MAKTLVNNPAGGFAEVEHDDNAVPMVAPDGKFYAIPKNNLNVALQNNWQLAQSGAPKPTADVTQAPLSPEDEEAQAKAEQTEADIQAGVQYNENHRVVEGLKRFGNEALFGIPEMISDYNASPEEREKNQEIRKRIADLHPVENVVEKGAGMLASLAIPGVGEAGDFVKGAVLGERALAGGAERVAGQLIKEDITAAGTKLTEDEISKGAEEAASKAYADHMAVANQGIKEDVAKQMDFVAGAELKGPVSAMKDATDAFFDRTYAAEGPVETKYADLFQGVPEERAITKVSWDAEKEAQWRPGTEEYWKHHFDNVGKEEFWKNMREAEQFHTLNKQTQANFVAQVLGSMGAGAVLGSTFGAVASLPVAVQAAVNGDLKASFETVGSGALLGGLFGGAGSAIQEYISQKLVREVLEEQEAQRLYNIGWKGPAKASEEDINAQRMKDWDNVIRENRKARKPASDEAKARYNSFIKDFKDKYGEDKVNAINEALKNAPEFVKAVKDRISNDVGFAADSLTDPTSPLRDFGTHYIPMFWADLKAQAKQKVETYLRSIGMDVQNISRAGAKQAAKAGSKAAWQTVYDVAVKAGASTEHASALASKVASKTGDNIFQNIITHIGNTIAQKAADIIGPLADKGTRKLTEGVLSTAEHKAMVSDFMDQLKLRAKGMFEDAQKVAREKAGAAEDAFRKLNLGADTTKTASSVISDVAHDSPSLLREVAAHAAKYGTQGAMYSALPAAVQAGYGDPEQAAETMLWGAGLSGLLGGAVGGVGKLAGKMTKGVLAPALGASAMHAAAAGLVGGSMFGLPGLFAGAAAGMFAEKAIHNFMNSKTLGAVTTYVKKVAQDSALKPYIGAFIAKSGNEALDKHLSNISGYLTGSKLATRTIVALNPYQHLTQQSGIGKSTDQQYTTMVQNIQNAAADTETTAHKVAEVSNVFAATSTNLAQAVAQKHLQAISYLNSQVPKNPNAPKPFQKDDWQPTKQQKQDFLDKVAVVNNPMIVWQHYQDGILSKTDRDVLQAVYPKIYQQMVNKIMAEAYDPRSKDLSHAQRMQLSTFTGQPLDPSLTHLGAIQQAVSTPVASAPNMNNQKSPKQRTREPKFAHSPSLETDSQRRLYKG